MKRARILVVDDDPTHLVCTKELLEAEGYEVFVHTGAFGATQQVMVRDPDLVLVDVNMPGLSGEGLVAVLRGRDPTRRARILLHSSNDEEALRAAARRLSIDGYVPKGDPRELRRRVAAVLASHGRAG
ncbi:response regulator [Anaeromyxobacter sp. Fw109-5]|uniref:response regulator n=1 Tax=Anaeromyxobacter sp. (strain Fw109-5) TaxID=404589 RepID=UPI0000ED71F3|nr:response regulator [Anaeromyxobacter sp. Fw109-5]ABS27812.1 response regulator receiver protein [Anaeromyxobacter sp. Fw109-5]